MTELFCKRCSFLLSDREIKNSFFLIDTKVIKTKYKNVDKEAYVVEIIINKT